MLAAFSMSRAELIFDVVKSISESLLFNAANDETPSGSTSAHTLRFGVKLRHTLVYLLQRG